MTRLTPVLLGLVLVAATVGPTLAAAPKRAALPTAAAQDGALVGLHALRREGGLVCMADHFHNGSSAGQPSRKAAEAAALRSWAEFTALEYGSHWGNPARAGSKVMRCSGDGRKWSCDFDARACRR